MWVRQGGGYGFTDNHTSKTSGFSARVTLWFGSRLQVLGGVAGAEEVLKRERSG